MHCCKTPWLLTRIRASLASGGSMRFKAKVGIGGQAMQEMEASAVLSGADERLTLAIRLRPIGWENAHDPWLVRGVDIDIPAECLPAIMDLLSRYR